MLASFLEDRWGDLASVIGLVVALVGFAVAIHQIRRSASAARAAEQAALAARIALAKNVTIGDLIRVAEALEQLKSRHLAEEWTLALDRYPEIRRLLADIRVRHPDLSGQERRVLQRLVDHLTDIEADVGRAWRGQAPPDVNWLNSPITDAVNVLYTIVSKLQQSI